MKQKLMTKQKGKLPDGWKWKNLSEVSRIFSGSSAPQDRESFDNGNNPFVRVSDLSKYKRTSNLIQVNNFVTDDCVLKEKLTRAKKGTLLFPKSGAAILTNNRALLGFEAYIVSHLAAVEPFEDVVISKWIYYYFLTLDMLNYCENPAYPSLKLSVIKKIIIPLPPLSEQQKIVEKLDKQMAEIEMMKKEDIQSNSKCQKLLASFINNEISKLDCDEISFSEIVDEFRYGSSSKANTLELGYPILRIPNIIGDEINLTDLKHTDLDDREYEKLSLKKGDLLFVRTNGNPYFIGRCAVFNMDENKYVFASYLIRARIRKELAVPDYVNILFKEGKGRLQLFSKATTSAGNYNINTESLKSIKLKIPDKKTQIKIIEKYNSMKLHITNVVVNQNKKSNAISQLPQSILNEVFGKYEIPEEV